MNELWMLELEKYFFFLLNDTSATNLQIGSWPYHLH
jgi:hypothetical protein